MKVYSFIIKATISLFFLLFFYGISSAQCNFQLDAQVLQNETCPGNGIVSVTISGSDINPSQVLITLTGGLIAEYSSSMDAQFTSLPAGQYTITAKVICTNNSESTQTTTVNINSEYDEMYAFIPSVNRNTLNCKSTGSIPIEIRNGSQPYTINITSHPAEYTGQTQFIIDIQAPLSHEINDLPAGNYTISVHDGCNYGISGINATVTTVSADFPMNVYDNYVYFDGCKRGTIYPRNLSDNDELSYYWNYYKSDFYEVAFSVDGVKNWQTPINSWNSFDLPDTYRKMYEQGKKIYIYLRIKDTNCEQLVGEAEIFEPQTIHDWVYKNCDEYFWNFRFDMDSGICLPYKWEIYDNNNNLINSVHSINNYDEQNIAGLKYDIEYTLKIIDAEGQEIILKKTEETMPPKISGYWSASGCKDYELYFDIGYACFPYNWEIFDQSDNSLISSKTGIEGYERQIIPNLEYGKDYFVKITDVNLLVDSFTYSNNAPPTKDISLSVDKYNCDDYDAFISPYGFCAPYDWQLMDIDSMVISSESAIEISSHFLSGLKYDSVYLIKIFDGLTERIREVKYSKPSIGVSWGYTNYGCNDYYTDIYPYSIYCYPYKMEVFDDSNNMVYSESNIDTIQGHNLVFEYDKSYRFIITDSNGDFHESSPIYASSNSYSSWFSPAHSLEPCVEKSGYMYIYGTIDIGTRISFIDGPEEPLHPDVTFTENIYEFYPFSEDYKYAENTHITQGVYSFEVTDRCGKIDTIIIDYTIDIEIKDFSYTLEETCEGITRLYPTGRIYENGSAVDTWFRIIEGPHGPSNSIYYTDIPIQYLQLEKTGNYVIQISRNSWGTCSYDTLSINHTQQSFTLEGRSSYVCEPGGVGHITVTAKNGKTPYTYELFNTDGTPVSGIPANNTGVFEFGTLGDKYTVVCTDACGKNFQIPVTITTLDQIPLITGLTEVCIGNEIELSCLLVGATNYQWITPNTTVNDRVITIPTASTHDAGQYIIKVQPVGCNISIADTIIVNVHGSPVPSAGDTIYYCQYETATQLYVKPSDGHSINWYDENQQALSEPPVPDTEHIGEIIYYIEQVSDHLGCKSDMEKVVVKINSLPITQAEASGWSCENANPQITVYNITQGYKYTLYSDEELTDIIYEFEGATSATENLTLPITVTEPTTLYLQTANKQGCSSVSANPVKIDMDIITLLPEILPVYTHNVPYSVQLTTNAIPSFSYTGSLVTGITLSTNGLISGTVPESAGFETGNFKVTVENANGCKKEKEYILQSCEPEPDIPYDEIAFCQYADAVPLQASSPKGLKLQWYDSNLNKLTDAPTPPTSVAGEQLYYVSQINETLNCEGPMAQIKVTVTPSPTISFNAYADKTCYKDSPTLFLYDLIEEYSYTIFSDNELSHQIISVTGKKSDIVKLNDTLENNTSYYITVTDNLKCSSAQSLTVDVDIIKLEIKPDKLPPYRKNMEYSQQLTTEANSAIFSIIEGELPVGLSLSITGRISGTVPSEQPTKNAVFTVQVEDENNCTAEKAYLLEGEFFVPKVFTPNGDGINDYFMTGYRLIIYDRLGLKIFEGDNGWDGTYKNKPAPQDIYFYKLFYEDENGNVKTKTGYIGLERN